MKDESTTFTPTTVTALEIGTLGLTDLDALIQSLLMFCLLPHLFGMSCKSDHIHMHRSHWSFVCMLITQTPTMRLTSFLSHLTIVQDFIHRQITVAIVEVQELLSAFTLPQTLPYICVVLHVVVLKHM